MNSIQNDLALSISEFITQEVIDSVVQELTLSLSRKDSGGKRKIAGREGGAKVQLSKTSLCFLYSANGRGDRL
jgi:hypothetical protein